MPSLICKTENLAEKIRFQQKEVERLKVEIFGTDRMPKSRYIRNFMNEFVEFEAISTHDDLLQDARGARFIYVGDYHALDKYQKFQEELLKDLAQEHSLVLAVEMFYARNQRALDDWMNGKISEEQFLRRVRYRLEWGYGWDSYRDLLQAARKLGVPVFGVDCSPRNDLRYIRARDTAAAARIADLSRNFPDRKVMVLFGESHLAAAHLPAKVRRHFPGPSPPQDLTVLQNLDEVYWKVACDGFEGKRVVRLRPGVYCVFNTTPFEKYEAYRRQLEIWKSQDREESQLDLTSTVYNLIVAVTDFIGVDRYRYCLTKEKVCIEFFVDAYPEVYSFEDFSDFETLLESSDFKKTQVHEILNHTLRRGSCYVPGINAIFIGKFNLTHGAEEAAHFVNFALKQQRFEHYRPEPLDQADEFYLSVLEEALGYFGSKLVDSSRNHLEESLVLNPGRARGAARKLLGLGSADLRWMRRFLIAHKDLERDYPTRRRIPPVIGRGVSSRGRIFTILTHELGYLLGEQIYLAYLDGLLSRRDIAELFRTRFEEAGPCAEAYFTLAERMEKIRLPLNLDRPS